MFNFLETMTAADPPLQDILAYYYLGHLQTTEKLFAHETTASKVA